MVNILGYSTMILAILMVGIALPSQITKNQIDRKCGLSLLMVLLPLAVYFSRLLYALCIKSWYIAFPDGLGVVFSLVLLIQYFHFKPKKEHKE